eukprot:scaffold1044_cov16-Prasinocladus_malaysianus.AAC.1
MPKYVRIFLSIQYRIVFVLVLVAPNQGSHVPGCAACRMLCRLTSPQRRPDRPNAPIQREQTCREYRVSLHAFRAAFGVNACVVPAVLLSLLSAARPADDRPPAATQREPVTSIYSYRCSLQLGTQCLIHF